MPVYKVTDTKTGSTYQVTGMNPPSQEELSQIIKDSQKQDISGTLKKVGNYFIAPFKSWVNANLSLGVGLGAAGKIGVARLTGNKKMEQETYGQVNQFINKQRQVDPDIYKATNPNATLGETVTGGAKMGAGLASYAIPGGGKWVGATGVPGKVGTAMLGGGLQAGLRETYNPEATPESVVRSTAFGAGTSGALTLGGEGIKALGNVAHEKLPNAGENIKVATTLKNWGKPTKTEGGIGLIKEMKSVGIDTHDPMKASQQVQDIIKSNAQTIRSVASDIPEKAVTSAKTKVVKSLDGAVSEAKTAIEREPLIRVRDDIIKDLYGGANEASAKGISSANDFYSVKQDYGIASKWNIKSSVTGKEADAYRIAYETMNEQLDKMLKDAGESGFREMNKQSHIAIGAGGYISRAMMNAGSKAPIGAYDLLAGLGGYLKGGIGGGIKTAILRRIFMSPTALNAYGSVVSGIGNVAEKAGNIGGGILGSPATGKVGAGLAQYGLGQNK